jgi:hypothetical protein
MEEPNQPTEPTAEPKRSRGLASYVVWGFGIVVLYLLSMGPVDLMGAKGMLGSTAYRILYYVYLPWEWAYLRTPLHKPLGMYMHLWTPEAYDRTGTLK